MAPKPYICRVYVTRGINLTLCEFQPTTYLRLSLSGHSVDLKNRSLRRLTANPDYYIYEDLSVDLPGSAFLSIEVLEDLKLAANVLGFTEVDLEDRFFSRKWQAMNRQFLGVPIEQRNLRGPEMRRLKSSNSVGKLEL